MTVVPLEQSRSNPFESDLSRAHSLYLASQESRLVRVLEPELSVPPLAAFVHDSFRSLVLNPQFACVAAKSAVHRGSYRMGVYDDLASAAATAGLARDLFAFREEQDTMDGDFTTFAAAFTGPPPPDEAAFERLLWAQLQSLHDADADSWDTLASPDPESGTFGFSFAGRAFFVVGLHPAASRWTRRFAWPTLVFNAHSQFERLKEDGRYGKLQTAIRQRDTALQGNINSMLSAFGERSEARQYAGRAVEDDWKCPFQAREKAGAK